MTTAPRMCPRCGSESAVAMCMLCSIPCVPSLLDGRYMLTRLVRHDPLGSRFQAQDQNNGGTLVAVRVGSTLDHAFLERFHKEVKLVAAVDHPLVSRVLDGGLEVEGRPYVASLWQEGMLLSKLIHDHGAIPLPRALSIASQVLRALHELHSVASVHGSLTTGSILIQTLGARENVKLLDVGFSWPSGHRHTDDAGPQDVQQDLQAVGHVLQAMLTGDADVPLTGPSLQAVQALLSQDTATRPVSALHAMALLQRLAPVTSELSNADLMVLETNEFSLVEAERRARSQNAALEMSGSRKVPVGAPASRVGMWVALALVLLAGVVTASWVARTPSSGAKGTHAPR